MRRSPEYSRDPKDRWIGVDLDRTLAYYDRFRGMDHIGKPIPAMQNQVMEWCAEGKTVKIFTARACEKENIPVIKLWLMIHGFPDLEVTNVKDFNCDAIYDDKAIFVVPNQGLFYNADKIQG